MALLPASANAASKGSAYPVITSVSPHKLGIGDVMTITGKNFRKGKNKNTVVFKRDGGRAVFVKAPDATTTKIGVTVPAKLLPFLLKKQGKRTFTRFRVRVLAKQLRQEVHHRGEVAHDRSRRHRRRHQGRLRRGQDPKNKVDTDDDNDLIPDTLEATLGTDPCKRDTDGDGESDGWEYYSALDRNGNAKPAPFARPYPNPLDGKDADIDHDGDGLTDIQEYTAWASFGANKLPLSYSGGNPASAGRGAPPAGMAYMDRDHNGFLSDFERDADGDGIPNMDEGGSKDEARHHHGPGRPTTRTTTTTGSSRSPTSTSRRSRPRTTIRSARASTRCRSTARTSCRTRSRPRRSIRSTGCRPTPTATASATTRTTRITTTSRTSRSTCRRSPPRSRTASTASSTPASRTPTRASACSAAPTSTATGSRTATTPTTTATACPTRSSRRSGPTRCAPTATATASRTATSTGPRSTSTAPLVPSPARSPYPNALDGTDANLDFDGDGLTLKQEYQAWNYSGRPLPLNYSDGNPKTGGTALRDGAKDVDGDGLTNFEETSGPMRIDWWTAKYDGQNGPKETPYPDAHRRFAEPSFIDPDSDGDGILDGNDDQDHDGYPNWFEASRPADWATTYTSTAFPYPATPGHTEPAGPRQPVQPVQADLQRRLPQPRADRLLRARRGLGEQRHARRGAAHGHAARHARLARGTAATAREPPRRKAGGSRRSGDR